jgi:dolichol-phosphate mannosyltransferase
VSTEKVGVVVPTYKEQDNIAALIREITRQLPLAKIAVIDDSPDQKTVEAARAVGMPAVLVFHRQSKGGRGSAVLAGVAHLLDEGCQHIFEMDADFSHPPAQMPEMLQKAKSENLDLLIASRYLPSSRIENWSLSRRLFSRGANLLARALLGVPVCDYTNGFRLYSPQAARLIIRTCGGMGKGFIALSEILVKIHNEKGRIGEMPTVFRNRLRGESSVGFGEISGALVGLVRLFFARIAG